MKIFLVRHGQSEGNVDKSKYFEKLDCDIELTMQGFKDATDAASHIIKLEYWNNSLDNEYDIYFSSYKRAIQTATSIVEKLSSEKELHARESIESPLIREREWGSLRDIVMSGKKTEDNFNFFYKPDGGESFADCYQRVVLFHQAYIQNSPQKNHIIVAHGEFNKLYMMYLLNWTVQDFKRWRTPRNGQVYLIEDGILSEYTPLSPDLRHNAVELD